MSDQIACVWVGSAAGPSSTAWSGSSHAWHTIQMGPGSVMRRSSRWRSPQSSHVMVTFMSTHTFAAVCDGASAHPFPRGNPTVTKRRH